MKKNDYSRIRLFMLLALVASLVVTSTRLQAQTGCSPSLGLPFTDLGSMPSGFCKAVAEAYFSGLTNGTSATTYSPDDIVTRAQMAAFTTRTMDQSLRRGSRRAALNQWWNPGSIAALDLSATPTRDSPMGVSSDGTDIWVVNHYDFGLMRVRASDGKVLQTWHGASSIGGPLVAMGRVFVGGMVSQNCPDVFGLLMTDPNGADLVKVAGNIGGNVEALAFDGAKIWTTNHSAGGCTFNSVSYITVGTTTPWSATNITTGFSQPFGILYDGSYIWITDRGENRLKKVDKFNGTVLQNIQVGNAPGHPVFDGMNIWVPNYGSDDITVVRVKDAAGNPLATPYVLKTLTAPFMVGPLTAAFDGERVLVACQSQVIFLFKAADLSVITGIGTGANTNPYGACSDGLNFFVTLNGTNELVRF